MHPLLILLFVFIVILIIYLFWKHTDIFMKEKFQSKTIDMVIARYNEPLDWLDKIDEDKLNKMNIIVYNKNPLPFSHPKANKIINLENVGKCDHTYLYHIINNYDNLANVTIFLPGSVDMDFKWYKGITTINKVLETNDTVFVAPVMYNDVKNDLYDFTLEEWATSSNQNFTLNNEIKTTRCNPMPYGKWFEKWFENDGNRLIIKNVIYTGIFAVSQRHIKNRPLEFYKELIKDVDSSSNPECGHFIERSWFAIFNPVEEKYHY